MVDFEPVGNRVLVLFEKEEEKRTKAGLILSEGRELPLHRGTVVAVGKLEEEISISLGDTVLFEKFGGRALDEDGKIFAVDVIDILAKKKEGGSDGS